MKDNKIAVIGLSGESIFMKMDHFNKEGETVVANTYHVEYGGKGYNQAVAAKRFGANLKKSPSQISERAIDVPRTGIIFPECFFKQWQFLPPGH